MIMMKVVYDIELDIATAHSRMSKKWKNRRMMWSELARRCSETIRTDESVAEYMRMSKVEQSGIKDVGGFVGGSLTGGQRKKGSVEHRSVATLDLDYASADVWDELTMQFSFACCMYSTHKHTAEHPRYRLVIPLSRNVATEEYEPLCRRIAEWIGIEQFDHTTYQAARLMYWPSTSRDGKFVFELQDGKPIDADAVLATYRDYRDATQWSTSSREGDTVARDMRQAGNPDEKPGLIGAFCRTYSIEDAIDTFLPDVYAPTGQAGRYTYRQGSVSGGLVCYGHKYAYSHHDTDPAGGRCCNAFDLCRIHLYGHLDGDRSDERDIDVTKLRSYAAMTKMASEDRNVRSTVARERIESVGEDFASVDVETESGARAGNGTDMGADESWMEGLELTRTGEIKSTMRNIRLVIENDSGLKGRLWHDLFSGFDMIEGGLPWDGKARVWSNRDDANLRVYLEDRYGLTGKDKIKDAKEAVLTEHQRHPIREYLESLTWDGVKRLDTLLIDFLGAEDSPLNRAMTRKHLVAAVARVMHPGCKYDYCLIVTGAEGIGKSSLFAVLGGDWFSDSLVTMEGQTGMEQARGGWIIELPELGSIKRSDVEQVKAYISRQDDTFRPAYGTVVEKHPRQCVFCGTTNEEYFLKGDTGNRRFWVVRAGMEERKYRDVRPELGKMRDQVWAEAVEAWKKGEKLWLDADMERQARERQQAFNDDSDDPTRELLEDFLSRKMPADWGTYDLNRRKAWWKDPDPMNAEATETRQVMCAAEFICERLGIDMSDVKYRYAARKVKNLMRDREDWEEVSMCKHVESLYGRQRGFRRKIQADKEDEI